MSATPSLRSHLFDTLRLALPVMIQRCGLIVMVTVDSIMAGQAGAQVLAHYGLSMAPQVTLMVIGIGFMVAATILAAQAVGRGRAGEVGAIWRIALVVGGLLGLLESAILAFGPQILLALDQAPELALPAGRALQMFALSMPALFLFLATTNVLEGIGRPKVGMVITLAANLVNAAGNWLLIEGHWGFPAMGAAGATLATSLTRWCMLAAALIYVLRLMPDRAAYGLALTGRAPLATLAKQLRLGLPLALSVCLQTAAIALLATFAGWLGPASVAAWQISNNVMGFVFMLSLGLGTATAVRVAQAIGRGDRAGRTRAGWIGFGLVLALQLVVGGAILLLSPWIARAYTPDAAVLALAVPALLWTGFLVVLDGAHLVLQNALRAGGDVYRPLAIYLLAYWLIMLPLAYGLGYRAGWGLEGLLLGLGIGLALAAVGLALRFRQIARRELLPI